MGKLLLTLILTLLLFYGAAKPSTIVKSSPTDSVAYYRQQLNGKWGIYVVIRNGSSTMCNVCPKIAFKEDGTAIIDNTKDNLKWNMLAKDILNFSANSMFPYPPYHMQFMQKKEFKELTLTSRDKRQSYILRQ